MKQHHYLITCFPLQGHISPTLQLAKNLAALGATVTFSTAASVLKSLHDRRLPATDGLSYASFSDENVSLTASYIAHLRQCGPENLTKIIQKSLDDGRPVTCLVYSLLVPWASTVARDMHVPSAFLAIQSAAAFAIYSRFFGRDSIESKGGGPDSSVCVKIQDLPTFSSCDLPTFVLPENPINRFMGPMMMEHMKELETLPKPLVLLNTFQELEQEAIKELESKLNVLAIGPLITTSYSCGEENYMEWLDSKPEKSVVYIAFGSLMVINKEQKVEILHGLVQGKRPFMWVVRSLDTKDEDEDEEVKKLVEEEMKKCDGMIVAWCSQMEVLSHKSIGCFVTHCGWNSTLEGLVCGVPMIGCPHISDQTTNAMLVEKVWENGVRARENGEVVLKREELRECLDVVMGEGERGEEIRKNALMLRGMAMEAVKDGGSSYNNLRKIMLE